MYCAPIKPPKSARSVRAQRHTDMPKAQKVGQAKRQKALFQEKKFMSRLVTQQTTDVFCLLETLRFSGFGENNIHGRK